MLKTLSRDNRKDSLRAAEELLRPHPFQAQGSKGKNSFDKRPVGHPVYTGELRKLYRCVHFPKYSEVPAAMVPGGLAASYCLRWWQILASTLWCLSAQMKAMGADLMDQQCLLFGCGVNQSGIRMAHFLGRKWPLVIGGVWVFIGHTKRWLNHWRLWQNVSVCVFREKNLKLVFTGKGWRASVLIFFLQESSYHKESMFIGTAILGLMCASFSETVLSLGKVLLGEDECFAFFLPSYSWVTLYWGLSFSISFSAGSSGMHDAGITRLWRLPLRFQREIREIR